MSTPAKIISTAQLRTHTNENNFPAATDGIDALNDVNDMINNEIVKRGKSQYFWDFFRQDSVIDQTEYNFEQWLVAWDGVANTIVNIKEISKVFIKYDTTDDFYTPVRYHTENDLVIDRDELAVNQSKNDPFFIINDRSIFIYPVPDVIVPLWIKIEAIYTPPKILLTSPESYLPLQQDKHTIYSLWMEWLIYKSQWKNKAADAQEAKKNFDEELTRLMTYLKWRSNQPKEKTLWDLSAYC